MCHFLLLRRLCFLDRASRMNMMTFTRKTLQDQYRSELLFYRQFHQHPINWWIHSIAIPIEWASWLIFLCYLQCHWMVATGTACYYLMIGSQISYIAAPAQLIFAFISSKICLAFDNVYNSIIFAIGLQIVSWSLQVGVGHKLIEKNNPGMTTSLTFNSIILSPILAWDCKTKC